jgi:hypothetical protein
MPTFAIQIHEGMMYYQYIQSNLFHDLGMDKSGTAPLANAAHFLIMFHMLIVKSEDITPDTRVTGKVLQ